METSYESKINKASNIAAMWWTSTLVSNIKKSENYDKNIIRNMIGFPALVAKGINGFQNDLEDLLKAELRNNNSFVYLAAKDGTPVGILNTIMNKYGLSYDFSPKNIIMIISKDKVIYRYNKEEKIYYLYDALSEEKNIKPGQYITSEDSNKIKSNNTYSGLGMPI